MARANGKDRGIFERPPGSGIWWIRYCDDSGREHREKVGPKSLARARYQQRKTEIRQEKFDPDLVAGRRRRVLVEDAIKEYLALNSHKRNAANDRRFGRIWSEEFRGKTLEEITSADIEKWRQRRMGPGEKPPSPATVNRELAFLRHIFNVLIRDGAVEKNPVARVKLFKENNTRIRFLSDEEEALLHQAFQEMEREEEWILVQIAIHTGMRRGEQFGLRWEDVDLQRGVITIPRSKHGERRHIDMSDYMQDIFRGLPSRLRSPWCFPNSTATGPLDPHHFYSRIFQPAVRKAAITDLHWHDLRHTHASRLVMAGVDLYTVKELLGHKTILMTQRYAHLSPGHRREAVNKLGRPKTTEKTIGTGIGTIA